MAASERRWRGRWAPSPTGPLHVGSARTALVAWLSVRRREGELVWRIEDLDPPRTVPGAASQQLDELAWLGLDWQEGVMVDGSEVGPHQPYRQSRRSQCYRAALERLAAGGRVFPCRRSRKDLQSLASAPHGGGGLPPYPASLRPVALEPGWLERLLALPEEADAAVRFRVDSDPVTFKDRVYGEIAEAVDRTVGDFVLRRRDGLWAYQLAVVADDLAMGIDEVVRGADLLDSTARQIQLGRALGGPVPEHAHVPLVLNAAGEKLSKRDGGATLEALRQEGVAAERLVGYLAFSLGLIDRPEPLAAEDLVPRFSWDRLRGDHWSLPVDWPAPLLGH